MLFATDIIWLHFSVSSLSKYADDYKLITLAIKIIMTLQTIIITLFKETENSNTRYSSLAVISDQTDLLIFLKI